MRKKKKYAKELSYWSKVVCPHCETVNWVRWIKSGGLKASFCCHECKKLSWTDENHYITFELIYHDHMEDYCQYGLDFPRD